MAYSLRDLASLQQAWTLAPDGWGSLVLRGTAAADSLAFSGGHHRILGLAGHDVIDVQGVEQGPGNAIFGGAGNDAITVTGDRNLVSGDAGDDIIRAGKLMMGAESDHSSIFGGSGNDDIFIAGDTNVVSGGAGDDRIQSTSDGFGLAEVHNRLDGDAGDDYISADGIDVRINGGAGSDYIRSSGGGREDLVGTAQTVTGGSGRDYFEFFTLRTLDVEGDQDGKLSQGDEILGLFSVLTDYSAGEVIDIGQAGNRYHDSYLTLGGQEPDRTPIRLGGHTHAIVEGDMTEAGHFVVDDQGDDLIIVYNFYDDANRYAAGSVVLQDYTGAVTILNHADAAVIA